MSSPYDFRKRRILRKRSHLMNKWLIWGISGVVVGCICAHINERFSQYESGTKEENEMKKVRGDLTHIIQRGGHYSRAGMQAINERQRSLYHPQNKYWQEPKMRVPHDPSRFIRSKQNIEEKDEGKI